MVAEAKELAADTIGPESEQTPRALEALTDLQEGALQAIEEGTGAAEVVAQLDESLEQFHSSLEDAEGGTYADIDTEAVDDAIEAIEAASVNVSLLLIKAASDSSTDDDTTSEASLAGEDERSLAALDQLSISSVSENGSDDEWPTDTSPTPLPERRADLAAALTQRLANPAARGPRTEEEEAQAIGEAKGVKQQAAADAARARRKDPEEQARRAQQRAQQRATQDRERKIQEAAAEARKKLLADKFGALREQGGFTPDRRAVSHVSTSSIVAQSPSVPTLEPGTPVQPVTRASPRAPDDDGDFVEDPSLDINEQAEQSLAEVPFSDDEESVSYYEESTTAALDQIEALLEDGGSRHRRDRLQGGGAGGAYGHQSPCALRDPSPYATPPPPRRHSGINMQPQVMGQ